MNAPKYRTKNIEQRFLERRIIFHFTWREAWGSPGGVREVPLTVLGLWPLYPGDVSVSFFFFSSSAAFRSPSSSSDSESEFAKRLFRFRLSCNDVSFFLVKRQNDVLVITCFFLELWHFRLGQLYHADLEHGT